MREGIANRNEPFQGKCYGAVNTAHQTDFHERQDILKDLVVEPSAVKITTQCVVWCWLSGVIAAIIKHKMFTFFEALKMLSQ